jgi:hypothetical protein
VQYDQVQGERKEHPAPQEVIPESQCGGGYHK